LSLARPMPTPSSHVSLSLVVAQDHRAVSDAELAQALSLGDAWAAVETWRRFAPMVLKLARRTLGSRSEADDIGQEVFCRIYRKVRTLREPDKLRNFVYTCAVRVLQTELHRRKMRSWLSFERPETLDLRACEGLSVESRDMLRRLYSALDRLSARDRIVFIMRRVEEMTIEEIAAALQSSESTVKRALMHASTRLSRWMEDEARPTTGAEKWGRR